MARQTYQVDFTGWEQTAALLEQLGDTWGDAEADKVIVGALKYACQPIVEAAKRFAPVHAGTRIVWHKGRKFAIEPGKLRNSILVEQSSVWGSPRGKRHRTYLPRTVTVGAFSPMAHFIEYGTGPRRTETGAYRGQVPARPFMRTALAVHKHDILPRLGPGVWAELKKRVRVLRKRDVRLIRRAGMAA